MNNYIYFQPLRACFISGYITILLHWKNRFLRINEIKRIQTFPDDYEFVGKYSSVRKQIGMAVPCRLSEIVTTAILNSFAGIEYPWVEPNLSE